MNELQNNISIVFLILLFVMLVSRAFILRKKGIRAVVFGKTDKRDFFLVAVFVLLIYPLAARAFGLPMWPLLVTPFWETPASGWVGIVFCAAALTGFAASLKAFGDSFRVGIDEEKPDKLVTTGMFAFSRNPLYLCFILFFLGMFLIHRNVMVALASVFLTLAIHRQILREETFLKSHYGSAYEDYCKKVRRYF